MISTESPWSIEAIRTNMNGYSLAPCVRCFNGDNGPNGKDFADIDNWKISQERLICKDEIIMLEKESDKVVSPFEQNIDTSSNKMIVQTLG